MLPLSISAYMLGMARDIYGSALSEGDTLYAAPPWVPRPLPSSDPTSQINPVTVKDLVGMEKLD